MRANIPARIQITCDICGNTDQEVDHSQKINIKVFKEVLDEYDKEYVQSAVIDMDLCNGCGTRIIKQVENDIQRPKAKT